MMLVWQMGLLLLIGYAVAFFSALKTLSTGAVSPVFWSKAALKEGLQKIISTNSYCLSTNPAFMPTNARFIDKIVRVVPLYGFVVEKGRLV
ncbi:hypothetical protein [Cesiribacter sp. SM1]|uniref:hypothetical protein n=1 Tax=Cesiribacter sp. SM1 TaxID=2861196 RepID=UPI001CD6F6C9|nr:hypothetical protein [Cesiribacter sp. SM1]